MYLVQRRHQAAAPSHCARVLSRSGGQYDDDVINTVLRNFYVDDCLRSVPTVQDACRLVPELTRLLARRGLRLETLVLNNAPMLASIPEGARAEHVAKYNAPVLESTPDGARVEYMAKYKLVDNCVWSVPTVQNVGRLVPELTRLLARRGLCL